MKLAEALLLIQKAPEGGSPYQLFLACGFSALHLQTFLTAHLQTRLNRRIEISTGLYGSLAETVEQLAEFQGEGAGLFIEWADLDARLGYRSLGGWGLAAAEQMVLSVDTTLARLALGIGRKPASLRLVVSLPTLDLPPAFHTVGWQSSATELALEKAVHTFGAKIASVPSVLVLNSQKLAAMSAAPERYDFRSDLNTGFPFTLRHADVLSQTVATLITVSTPKKGLITDLDDTMWRGIVGEVGPDAVAWDLAGHAQTHGLYQQMLQALAEQGVLIGIASKNNAQTAEKALRRNDFVVQREKMFPAEIHWEAKSQSVGRILKTWNVGADSVVFIDDSQMEIEEVHAAHPAIECILFPKNNYATMFALLRRLRDVFGKPQLSDEDSYRLESIRNSQTFLESADSGTYAEHFLAAAEAHLTFEFNPLPEDARILDLVNKTNQFNLNGKRFNAVEWHSMADRPDAFVVSVSYKDKFGPLGKIAVVSGQKTGGLVRIEAWVMSCRAFSRRIEHQTLKQIFEQTGADNIEFAYVETAKNGPAKDFIKSFADGIGPILTSETFLAKCPPLYHQVETSWTTQNSV